MPRAPLALLLLVAPLVPLRAQGWIDIERPVVPIRGPAMLVRVGSTVRAVVDGRVARFEVEERFRNTGPVIAEGTYLYPLPGEAVFTEFSLFQGGKELKGEMMTADQARTIYEGIVRKLRDPALLTLVGHGLIRAQVFPVQPGETRTVTLRFTELLAAKATRSGSSTPPATAATPRSRCRSKSGARRSSRRPTPPRTSWAKRGATARCA